MVDVRADTLGIDFGTSNSAVACVGADGIARLVPLEGTEINIPTAVFFNAEERSIHFGREAIALYLAGVDGRLMRSLKSLLGSSLLHEQTRVPEGMVSFQDVISRFIREIVLRANRQRGVEVRRAVIGRPVHFVDDAPQRDKQAQAALQKAAAAAGLVEISFELEPIAAAFDYEMRLAKESVVLIVDIGGGTSDFTVVRLGPERARHTDRASDVLATSGVHIGGTDYDRKLSLERVMPLFGLRHIGPLGREVPNSVFFDLSTWHLINWLYAPKSLRQMEDLRTSYSDKRLHDRLMTVLNERLGHRLASEVEQAKIANSISDDGARVDLSRVEPGLFAAFDSHDMGRDLDGLLQQVVQCGLECVRSAGLAHGQLDAIYLTGGSSALRPFQTALQQGFAGVTLVEGDLFGGVASGLAYAGQRRELKAVISAR
ncbi:Hsp70 family protein [Caenimonas koreensis DSM 17982]|uniref:Hsp70 family protein n=1 Tax=Caenimonas koreensis DSM 17982 TaxID=1121255 RepID=A0A844BB14_9BURK|nr:Hsp70 family protein [Caenimonas koreensis]MRD47711.1 Hsp70 family protein [Caenimonas koreensis DSM 17982]